MKLIMRLILFSYQTLYLVTETFSTVITSYRGFIFMLISFVGVRTNCFRHNSSSVLTLSRLNFDKIIASPIFVVKYHQTHSNAVSWPIAEGLQHLNCHDKNSRTTGLQQFEFSNRFFFFGLNFRGVKLCTKLMIAFYMLK